MRILIVEDDPKIAKFLRQGLKEEGYAVAWERDGEAGLAAARASEFDLLILDGMLPGMDGLQICRRLRREGRRTPVLMLTARDTIEDRVEGLDAGADDYLVKPFAFSELLARLRALTRRLAEPGAPRLVLGPLELDPVSHRARYADKTIELTSREFALLHLFLRRRGQVLSRTIIAESVWGYDFQSGTNVIDVYVNYLRTKLKRITGRDYIRTVRGQGYAFEEPGA